MPDDGPRRQGLTAQLWITVPSDESKNVCVRVHPGQIVRAAGQTIHVLAVEADAVRLTINAKQ